MAEREMFEMAAIFKIAKTQNNQQTSTYNILNLTLNPNLNLNPNTNPNTNLKGNMTQILLLSHLKE